MDLDVVFCVDVTAGSSLGLGLFREYIPEFIGDIESRMASMGCAPQRKRVKLILFGDLNAGADAVTETGFLDPADEAGEFRKALDSIEPRREIEGSGLDALALAMRPDRHEPGEEYHHVIFVLSFGGALPLDDGKKHLPGSPKDLDELRDWWENGLPGGGSGQGFRSLILLSGSFSPWNEIRNWERVQVIFPS